MHFLPSTVQIEGARRICRAWIFISIICIKLEESKAMSSTHHGVKTEVSRDPDQLKEIFEMYGIKEELILPKTNSSPGTGVNDARFEFGERLIQAALHEEADAAKVQEMRIRIQELIDRPTQKESDPTVSDPPMNLNNER